MTVFVVGAGEYEQWNVCHVAASLDSAVAAIRANYAKHGIVIKDDDAMPTKVSWADRSWEYTVVVLEQCGYRLTVPIISAYDITEWDVAA